MPQEYTLQQALQEAILAKKDLRDFYHEAARMTLDPNSRKILQRLSKEVEDNIKKFFNYYRGREFGTLEEFLTTPPRRNSTMLRELRKAKDQKMPAKRARELAMREEKAMENSFRRAARQVVDPLAREIFADVADEAARHYALIESEYEYQTSRIHETDINTYVRE